ncbi:MAG: hypothetical protein U0M21_03320 [Emergencia sp.]|nr:hypothetical protein [Emergencia sp.]
MKRITIITYMIVAVVAVAMRISWEVGWMVTNELFYGVILWFLFFQALSFLGSILICKDKVYFKLLYLFEIACLSILIIPDRVESISELGSIIVENPYMMRSLWAALLGTLLSSGIIWLMKIVDLYTKKIEE